MRERISKIKRDSLLRFKEKNQATIRDYHFNKGDLVLVRNTAIESSLNKKMKPRYLEPMIIVARRQGGSYIVAEMDGSVWQQKVTAFRIMPYFARRSLTLPENIHEILDQDEEALKKIDESEWDGDDILFSDKGKASEVQPELEEEESDS
ncbi:hypothetical protein M413DRAFT_73156 [Hebeloma cylindrosporum]|uniref:Uncharacterized protein n=1 Tax=Hebeloma cylindrosporum TaxID=76867 RepID=A0A0C2XRT1_HEBCY|nr:hypothetical protein M413DRAFT_73156 [Hebeloma cylindrosporum h7]